MPIGGCPFFRENSCIARGKFETANYAKSLYDKGYRPCFWHLGTINPWVTLITVYQNPYKLVNNLRIIGNKFLLILNVVENNKTL
ncbi:hypothetical protein SPLC1_S240910 [Arthrospira platensis C1]|uniref:Uncharacterized protein n=1 Tax=Limnospira indica PCC 8005 TaxID=376219 RepID=A0A9P1KJD5_9CYAN|nr:hypothetical protein AP285_17810 [Arthrospira platensis YZ]EKD08423.1 hypothetical protein SPLC1_S240910 [Arthrospira platensis C1]RAQ48987.1 hypothetical protein B9S53_01300 [Arthrospira sp. O9.13F]CDM97307.1 conserved protein of unknown function [Limnospira indica PCC 8005]